MKIAFTFTYVARRLFAVAKYSKDITPGAKRKRQISSKFSIEVNQQR